MFTFLLALHTKSKVFVTEGRQITPSSPSTIYATTLLMPLLSLTPYWRSLRCPFATWRKCLFSKALAKIIPVVEDKVSWCSWSMPAQSPLTIGYSLKDSAAKSDGRTYFIALIGNFSSMYCFKVSIQSSSRSLYSFFIVFLYSNSSFDNSSRCWKKKKKAWKNWLALKKS